MTQKEIISSPTHKYEVLEFLGRGAFGQVAKCRNLNTNEIVAIKFLKNLPRYARQGMIEAAILARLSRESSEEANWVVWHETFVHRSHLCLVFELLQQSIYDFLKERQFSPLPLRIVRPMLQQLLTALHKLKQLGLIHTDLKPDNIMLVNAVTQPWRVKIIDFGCAAEVNSIPGHFYVQSRYYRSPEVILGLAFCEAIDMWSLGCVVAELFLGRPRYPGNSEFEMMQYISRTLGLPTEAMLDCGKKTSRLFTRAGGALTSWRLKTPREYEEATGDIYREPVPTNLRDFHLLNVPTDLTGDQLAAERADRREFVDLLKNMLAVDHSQRITPEGALRHEFITLAHLVDYGHCHNVKASVEMMEVCRRAERVAGGVGSSGPAPQTDSLSRRGGKKRRLPPEALPLKKRCKMLNPRGPQIFETPPPPPPEKSNNNRRTMTEAEATAVDALLLLAQ